MSRSVAMVSCAFSFALGLVCCYFLQSPEPLPPEITLTHTGLGRSVVPSCDSEPEPSRVSDPEIGQVQGVEGEQREEPTPPSSVALLEHFRIYGTPHDSLIMDLLKAYPNESDNHFLNRVMNSRDIKKGALVQSMFMLSQEDPIGTALDRLGNPVFAASDLAAARVLQYHRDALTEDHRNLLSQTFEDQSFPNSFGAALALAGIGDTVYLDIWRDTAMDKLNRRSLTPREARRVIQMCKAAYSDGFRELLEAIAEDFPGTVGRQADELVKSLRDEPEDPEEMVHDALRAAVEGR